MKPLSVVTARVLVVLSSSFTSQIETGPTLTWFSNSLGIHSPQCWEAGFNTKYTMPAITGYRTRAADMSHICANHYTIQASNSWPPWHIQWPLCVAMVTGGVFLSTGSSDQVVRTYCFTTHLPEKICELEAHVVSTHSTLRVTRLWKDFSIF